MPAAIGVVPMNQSSVEKKGWSAHTAIRSRPVHARASLTAAVVTSEPFFANLTISAHATMPCSASAARTSSGEGRVKFSPRRISRIAASVTVGCAWPSVTARSPIPYSTYSFPSKSQTWQPWPRSRNGGAARGYWSSPLA